MFLTRSIKKKMERGNDKMQHYTKAIRIRISEEDYQAIQEAAKKERVNLSVYVRSKLTSRIQDQPGVRQEFQNLNYEVNRIGNNINQIARNYNLNLYHPDDVKDLKRLLEEVHDLFLDMRRKLRR